MERAPAEARATVDIDPASREHRRLWLGARLLWLTVPYPLAFTLAVQTGVGPLDAAVYAGGPFLLLLAWLVAFHVSGRLVARAGRVVAVVFVAYLALNAVFVVDTNRRTS